MPLEFNSSTFYTGINSNLVSIPGGPSTVVFWFITTNAASIQQILTTYNLSNPTTRFARISITSSALNISMQGSTGSCNFSHGSISSNTWYCAVIRFASSSSRNMWLNSQNSQTSDANSVVYTGASATQGRMSLGGTNSTGSFSGRIAHLAMWNSVLSDSDVRLLHSGISPLFISRTSLKHYIPYGVPYTNSQIDIIGRKDALSLSGTERWSYEDGLVSFPTSPVIGKRRATQSSNIVIGNISFDLDSIFAKNTNLLLLPTLIFPEDCLVNGTPSLIINQASEFSNVSDLNVIGGKLVGATVVLDAESSTAATANRIILPAAVLRQFADINPLQTIILNGSTNLDSKIEISPASNRIVAAASSVLCNSDAGLNATRLISSLGELLSTADISVLPAMIIGGNMAAAADSQASYGGSTVMSGRTSVEANTTFSLLNSLLINSSLRAGCDSSLLSQQTISVGGSVRFSVDTLLSSVANRIISESPLLRTTADISGNASLIANSSASLNSNSETSYQSNRILSFLLGLNNDAKLNSSGNLVSISSASLNVDSQINGGGSRVMLPILQMPANALNLSSASIIMRAGQSLNQNVEIGANSNRVISNSVSASQQSEISSVGYKVVLSESQLQSISDLIIKLGNTYEGSILLSNTFEINSRGQKVHEGAIVYDLNSSLGLEIQKILAGSVSLNADSSLQAAIQPVIIVPFTLTITRELQEQMNIMKTKAVEHLILPTSDLNSVFLNEMNQTMSIKRISE